MKQRFGVVFVLFISIWILLFARAAVLQLLPDEQLTGFQKRQFETVVTLQPRRGDILDRNGKELAISVSAFSLFADPKLVKRPRHTARTIASLTGKHPDFYYQKMRGSKRRFVWLERRLSPTLRDKIQTLKLSGLDFVEEPKRVYPNGSLFGQVLGHIGIDGQGLAGLELQFDQDLSGARRKVPMSRDARGRPLILNGRLFSEPPDGATFTLTIDREIQYRLERELRRSLTEHDAESAVGVILDAKTSEILAMGSVPGFNPNEPQQSELENRRNRTITDPIEPGSTMKTFAVAAAIKEKVVVANTPIDCENGEFRIGSLKVREADENHRFKTLTVNEVLSRSSNVGSAKIALQTGAQKLRDTLTLFGFGAKSGASLPGESRGILPPLPWTPHQIATISFGQGMAATPLQIVNAYAAIANGGYLRRPQILKSLLYKDGEQEKFEPDLRGHQVLSAIDASHLTFMLMGVTSSQGTGFRARVDGFQVAGKTGTSQKADLHRRGYRPGVYISSFVGFLPAHAPEFVIYVAVDSPKKGYYGADVAAPLFGRIAEFVVQRANLSPNLLSQGDIQPEVFRVQKSKSNFDSTKHVTESHAKGIPDLRGLPLKVALDRLKGLGVKVEISGLGVVSEMNPYPGAEFLPGDRVKLVLQ